MEKSIQRGSLEHLVKLWGEEWSQVLVFAGGLAAMGFLFGLTGWEFGMTAAMLALVYNRLAGSPVRIVMFLLCGGGSVALSFQMGIVGVSLIPAMAAYAFGFLYGGFEAEPNEVEPKPGVPSSRRRGGRVTLADRLRRGWEELPLGLFAGWIFLSLLVRGHTWTYLPVQLASAIFCILLLILTRNRLLSVSLSIGIVLLAALKMPA